MSNEQIKFRKDYPRWQPRFLPGKSTLFGGWPQGFWEGQSLLTKNENFRGRSFSSIGLGDFKKRNLLFIRENQTLRDRITSLEARLANLEERDESYHTDENEFTSPREKEPILLRGNMIGYLNLGRSRREKPSICLKSWIYLQTLTFSRNI